MKIRRISVLVLLFAMVLSTAVFADIAYEPADDFYSEHRDECEYENRVWITNGGKGCVVGYSSPTGSAKLTFPNGLEYYVSYTWSDGTVLWGCIEYEPATAEGELSFNIDSAWVDMSSMTPRYDSKAFMADHASELSNEERTIKIAADEEVITYRYPGSGIVTGSIYNYSGEEYSTLNLSSIYLDSEGREWGYCGYYYGQRELWICISEPYTELAAGAEFTEPEIIPAADEAAMEDAMKQAGGLSVSIAVFAVGVVIIAAAIIAYIVIRKRRGA